MPKDTPAALPIRTAEDRFDAFLQVQRDMSAEARQADIIGNGMGIETPYGVKALVYADYVASGRALASVEGFVQAQVLPIYSNSHTEASHCGREITRMRRAARDVVARECGAGAGDHVVFCGSGATAGLNRLAGLMRLSERVAAGERVRVLHGPYEHHSNILPWRESGAEVIEIAEAPTGGPDMAMLAEALAVPADLIVGAFSAASNVTGRLTDVAAVTRLLQAHGALAIWDYACAAPYVEMTMQPAPDVALDAIVFSPHKFLGGPGASGVLIVADRLVDRTTPTAPGGGTVSFVSPWAHDYVASVSAREEAGTPNVVGDIRVALALLVKAGMGIGAIVAREEELRLRALEAWADLPMLKLLGQCAEVPALPIFSLQVFGTEGQLHQQMITRMLSDHHGVQARGGCACAGPYAHRLLEIDEAQSAALLADLRAGHELRKPGWTRLNLAACHSEAEIATILAAVRHIALNAQALSADYVADPATARFSCRAA